MQNTVRKPYDSDVTDAEWALIRPLLPPHPPCGSDSTVPRRKIVNAVFYINNMAVLGVDCHTICPSGKPSMDIFARVSKRECGNG